MCKGLINWLIDWLIDWHWIVALIHAIVASCSSTWSILSVRSNTTTRSSSFPMNASLWRKTRSRHHRDHLRELPRELPRELLSKLVVVLCPRRPTVHPVRRGVVALWGTRIQPARPPIVPPPPVSLASIRYGGPDGIRKLSQRYLWVVVVLAMAALWEWECVHVCVYRMNIAWVEVRNAGAVSTNFNMCTLSCL